MLQLLKTGSTGRRAAERIGNDRIATGCDQGIELKVGELSFRGEAGIADVQILVVWKLRTGCK
jgi:hypothetical protein